MNLSVEYVARSKRLEVEAFTKFASTHPDAFVDTFSEVLSTNTWFVDGLVADFLALGNVRLPWVKDPNGAGTINAAGFYAADMQKLIMSLQDAFSK